MFSTLAVVAVVQSVVTDTSWPMTQCHQVQMIFLMVLFIGNCQHSRDRIADRFTFYPLASFKNQWNRNQQEIIGPGRHCVDLQQASATGLKHQDGGPPTITKVGNN
ncbi:hypothetical protein CDL15_Pgr011190 [Punica granatum]|uniref:Uncharacterized protein n=1 Tax=Punica granatum TaxID=22663 RepID=A0A218WEU2_PUNGR|nr:hypothetical protein CDL15_Pgr011190 [Punica granatum]